MKLNHKKIQQHLICLLSKNQEGIKPSCILLQGSTIDKISNILNEAHTVIKIH